MKVAILQPEEPSKMSGKLPITTLLVRGFIFVVFAWLPVFAFPHLAAMADDNASENAASMTAPAIDA